MPNAKLKRFIRISLKYLQPSNGEGSFGGFFRTGQKASDAMKKLDYRPVGNTFEPCVLADTKGLGRPVPKGAIRTRRFMPDTEGETLAVRHRIVSFRADKKK